MLNVKNANLLQIKGAKGLLYTFFLIQELNDISIIVKTSALFWISCITSIKAIQNIGFLLYFYIIVLILKCFFIKKLIVKNILFTCCISVYFSFFSRSILKLKNIKKICPMFHESLKVHGTISRSMPFFNKMPKLE